jgi:hypothetical protein
VHGAPIAAVVFPRIAPEIDTSVFEPVPPAQGAARLRDCLYGARAQARVRTVFEHVASRMSAPDDQAAVLDDLASRVPCLQARLGRRAYQCAPGEWLRALGLGYSCER